MGGFGLVDIKPEGYASALDDSVEPYRFVYWKHHHMKLHKHMGSIGKKWYEWPIRRYLRRVYTDGWDDALCANAMGKGKEC